MTTYARGDVCEFCLRRAAPWPRTGKRRYPHKCPHGLPCRRGDRLLGWHQNWPDNCADCMAAYRARVDADARMTKIA